MWKSKTQAEEIPEGFVIWLLLFQLQDDFCCLLEELEYGGKFRGWLTLYDRLKVCYISANDLILFFFMAD